ncbi:TetR/AcrR family transcriptional regulator [Paracoccus sp. NSM]|uniref:TetR/AcrR family transcriptional regulator n=1 Tax=Paracoccus sp. NSM TaxID=3457784 RepID=UPI00403551C6
MEISTKRGPGRIGRAGRLSRDRVLEAGLSILREAGMDGLTMRALSDRLGSGLMTLYHHVRDRDDLLDGLIDRVAAEIPHPSPRPCPVDEIVSILCALYDAMRADPWLVRCLIDGHPGSPTVWPLIERVALAIETLGLEGAEAGHVYHALIHYTYGEVLVMEARSRRGLPFAMEDAEQALRYPAIARTLASPDLYPCRADPYPQNLRRMVTSIRDAAEAGPTPRPGPVA